MNSKGERGSLQHRTRRTPSPSKYFFFRPRLGCSAIRTIVDSTVLLLACSIILVVMVIWKAASKL